jgi:hypothetical protein
LVLQKLMRHANIRTTERYYANVDDAAAQAILGQQRVTPRVTPDQPGEGVEPRSFS